MFKLILFITVVFFSATSSAFVDTDLACKEKEEQEKSLLPMSTSLIEAHLAGQCIGYKSYYKIVWVEACSEFIEQKKSLLSMSTSLKEANLAGQCKGAIYQIVEKKCGTNIKSIDYYSIADGASSASSVRKKVNNGGAYCGK